MLYADLFFYTEKPAGKGGFSSYLAGDGKSLRSQAASFSATHLRRILAARSSLISTMRAEPAFRAFLDAAVEAAFAVVAQAEQVVGAVEAKVGTEAFHQRAAGTPVRGRREVGQFQTDRFVVH